MNFTVKLFAVRANFPVRRASISIYPAMLSLLMSVADYLKKYRSSHNSVHSCGLR